MFVPGVFQHLAQPEKAVAALEDVYTLVTDGFGSDALLREATRTHALHYDVDTVMQQYMLPVLDKIQRDISLRNIPLSTQPEKLIQVLRQPEREAHAV
jgi:hypothetical protein